MGGASTVLIAALVIGQLAVGGASGDLVAAQTAASISGVVATDGTSALPAPYDSGGSQPVPANVTLIDAATGTTVSTTTTAADGSYRFDQLADGAHQVSATARDIATPLWFGAGFGDRATQTPTVVPVDGTAPAKSDVDLRFPSGAMHPPAGEAISAPHQLSGCFRTL